MFIFMPIGLCCSQFWSEKFLFSVIIIETNNWSIWDIYITVSVEIWMDHLYQSPSSKAQGALWKIGEKNVKSWDVEKRPVKWWLLNITQLLFISTHCDGLNKTKAVKIPALIEECPPKTQPWRKGFWYW